ncbi:MAG: electron transport complex subunit RsxG [Gammaproteobacteria bacterium]
MNLWRTMSISAIVLSVFAIGGTALVAWTFSATEKRIAENERQVLLHQLHALIPADEYDNQLDEDVIQVTAPQQLGSKTPLKIYRARKDQQPVAAIISAVAPDGYNGDINLLVAIRYDGTLAGVRVTRHRETPGLGDAIDERRSDWIHHFTGKSLTYPPARDWKVKRDGGVFDQFTGATVTPRAIVNAVYRALRYFAQHRDRLFASNEGQHANDH